MSVRTGFSGTQLGIVDPRLAGRGRLGWTTRRNGNCKTLNAHGTGRDHFSPVRLSQDWLTWRFLFQATPDHWLLAGHEVLSPTADGEQRLFRGPTLLPTVPLLSVAKVKLAALLDRWYCYWLYVNRCHEEVAIRSPNSWGQNCACLLSLKGGQSHSVFSSFSCLLPWKDHVRQGE